MRKVDFSGFKLDLDIFELSRDGVAVEVGSRTLDLLVYLIENRCRVVEYDELRRNVWQSAALSRSSIPTCVRELRIALGDDASAPQIIDTSRGRGYRFIGEITNISLENEGSASTFPMELPFAGRLRELEMLGATLKKVINEARCKLVLIRGEAGIGKTRLLEQFCDSVGADVRRYAAANSDSESDLSFSLWTKILREAVKDQHANNAALVDSVNALATIFPELSNNSFRPSDSVRQVDRHSILTLWAHATRSLVARQPVLLTFENLHLADIDSLSLLSWLCNIHSSEPILIVATQRPRANTTAGSRRLAELAAADYAEVHDLGPLSATEISSMLDPLIDGRSALADELRRRTSGNAFYVTHLVRYIGQKSIAESPESVVSRLPPRADEIVARQLSDLPHSTIRALAIGAVAGLSFQSESVGLVLEVSASVVVRMLEPAVEAWFLVEDHVGYRFTHALLRDALYDFLDIADRKQIHLTVAHDIRERSETAASIAEVAEHLALALPFGDEMLALEASRTAAREASSRFAFERAQILYERALSIMKNAHTALPSDQCSVLLELAECQLYAGQRAGARSTLREAAHIARSNNKPSLLAECALRLAPDFLSIEVGNVDSPLIKLLEEALAELPAGFDAVKAKLYARLCLALAWTEQRDQAEMYAIDAVSIARETKDLSALNSALAARSDSLHGPDRLAQRKVLICELGKGLRKSGSLPETMMFHVREVAVNLEIGNIPAVDAAIESAEDISSEMDLPHYCWYPGAFRSMRAIMRGDFTTAESLGEAYYELARGTDDQNVHASRLCQAAHVLIERGAAESAISFADSMVINSPMARSWAACLGWVHLVAGNKNRAAGLLESFRPEDLVNLYREPGGSAGIGALAEIAAQMPERNPDTTRELYRLCRAAGDSSATLGYGITYLGCFQRYAGLLADAKGDHEIAYSHFDRAISVENSRGAPIYRALAEVDLAAMLERTGSGVDVAQQLVCSAEKTAQQFGAYRLITRLAESSGLAL